MGALERFLDARQKVGVFCGGLAMLGAGAVLWIGPDDIPEKLPQHRLVGVCAAGFGVLALAVLFLGKSAAGRRLRGLLLAAAAGALALLCWFGIAPKARDAWRLSKDGRAAQAEIVRVRRVFRDKRFTTELFLAYDGHRATMVAPGREGGRVAVLYLPEDPSVVVPAGDSREFLDLAQRMVGGTWLWLGSLFGLTCAFVALAGLKGFLFGAPPDPA